MEKLNRYIILILVATLLINSSYGFPGMTSNKSTEQTELTNTTQSDQDIQLLQHLVEVDAIQFQSENKLYIRETMVFNNKGTRNFSGTLATWLPDGAGDISVAQIEMSMNGGLNPVPMLRKSVSEGQIISWNASIGINNSLPPLYTVAYTVPAGSKDAAAPSKNYSKIFLYPTETKQPGSIVLKITSNKGDNIAVTDGKGNSLASSGNPREEDNSLLYMWEMPEFTQLNIELSKPAVIAPSGIAGYSIYVILGLLIILAVSYPVLRKKSEKLQSVEGKLKNLSGKKPEDTGEKADEDAEDETEEAVEEADKEETEPKDTDDGLSGKTKDELEKEKSEILSSLSKLDKDYASGNLLDEEYEEMRKSYQDRIKKIARRLERLN